MYFDIIIFYHGQFSKGSIFLSYNFIFFQSLLIVAATFNFNLISFWKVIYLCVDVL